MTIWNNSEIMYINLSKNIGRRLLKKTLGIKRLLSSSFVKESGSLESGLTAAAPSKPTVTRSTGKTDSRDDRVRIVNKIQKAGKKLQLVDLLGRRAGG